MNAQDNLLCARSSPQLDYPFLSAQEVPDFHCYPTLNALLPPSPMLGRYSAMLVLSNPRISHANGRYDAKLFELMLSQIWKDFHMSDGYADPHDADPYQSAMVAFVRFGSVLALIFMAIADLKCVCMLQSQGTWQSEDGWNDISRVTS